MKTIIQSKKIHLEIIRILAIFMVIFQHTSTYGAQLFYNAPNEIDYVLSLFFSMFCKIAVPLFFMISGALLLGKDEPIKVILKKRVSRFFIVLFVMSVFYYLFRSKILSYDISFYDFIKKFVSGQISEPLWYLYSYLAVLLLLPFLRFMVKNMEIKHYIYLFILNFIFLTLYSVIDYFYLKTHLTSYFSIYLVLERNTFFFLMGYFVENKIPKKYFTAQNTVIASVFAVLFIIICCILTYIVCLRDGYSNDVSLVFYNKFISVTAIGLYFSIKYICEQITFPDKIKKIIFFLSANTFGIYLFEYLIRALSNNLITFLVSKTDDFFACILWIFIVFIICNIIVSLLRLIPFVRKYI